MDATGDFPLLQGSDLAGRLRLGLGGRYAIDRPLARGGMGALFLARDIKHGRRVVIKVLPPELGNEVSSERFLREIRTTAQLNHPHILALFDSGTVDGLLFYVMPYVDGESLAETIRRRGPLPVEQALLITSQVADALAYAHSQGFVHRDVKPGNIMIAGSNHSWVVDFGLSRALYVVSSTELTTEGSAIGSPLYMSPEQINQAFAIDARTDIYSLGCVLFEMLAGRPPFSGRTVQSVLTAHLMDAPPNVSNHRVGVPAHVCAALSRALEKDPSLRFSSASEFAAALEAPSQAYGYPAREEPRARRYWSGSVLWIAGAVAGVALALTAVISIARLLDNPEINGDLSIGVVLLPPSTPGTVPGALDASNFVETVAHALEAVPGLRVTVGSSLLDGVSWRSVPLTDLLRRANAIGARYVVAADISPGANGTISMSVFDAVSGHRVHRAVGGGTDETIDRAIGRLGLDAVRTIADASELPLQSVERLMMATESPFALTAVLEGRQLLWQGKVDAAIESFERSLASDSGYAPAYYYLSAAQLSSPYWDANASLKSLDAGLLHRTEMPLRWVALLQAQRAFVMRSSPDAIQGFHQLTGDDPEFAEAWLGLGEAYYHLSGFLGLGPASSLPAFRRLAELDPTFAQREVLTHLVDAAIWAEDEQTAREYLPRIPFAEERLSRRIALDLYFGNRRVREAALSELTRADLRAIAQVAYLTARQPKLLADVAAILTAESRSESDRSIGFQFRLAALAGAGRWADALAMWSTRQRPPPFDSWIIQAQLAGHDAGDLADPMVRRAKAMLPLGVSVEFSDRGTPELTALRVLANCAFLYGDSARIQQSLALLETARAGPADPEPSALSQSLKARLALLAADTGTAVRLLTESLARAPWDLSDYYSPMKDAGVQRIVLARLLMATGRKSEAQRWTASFGNSLAVSDVFFRSEADSILRLIARN